jgi:hypothetical protein
MSRCSVQWRLVGALGLVSLIGACSVADSLYVDPAAMRAASFTASAGAPLCKTSLGSYSLPKTFLKVIVQRGADGTPQLGSITEIRRAESSLTFCLDHLADPLADDEIRVIKSSGQVDPSYGATKVAGQFTDNGAGATPAQPATSTLPNTYGSQLLQWVVSNTVDQSEYIAKVLIRTAFVALSGKPNFTPLQRSGSAGELPNLAVLEYDPFDLERSALINQRLRLLGFCLVLENFTFDTRRMTVDQYCNEPRLIQTAFTEAYTAYQSAPPPRIGGIAYRPRVSYGLSIYQKANSRGHWRLFKQQKVSLENISPVVSIGITRSIFAARRVALMFDMGVLKSMCLVKTSELQSAVQVPYEIAKSIIVLPTQVFEVKIGNVNDNISLLQAENGLIQAQQDYLDLLNDQTKKTFTNPTDKSVQPLPDIPNPLAETVPVPRSTFANLSELQSSVLTQICANAPSVLVPENRTEGKP